MVARRASLMDSGGLTFPNPERSYRICQPDYFIQEFTFCSQRDNLPINQRVLATLLAVHLTWVLTPFGDEGSKGATEAPR